MSNVPPETIVFDLGGVLIDWNPRYLYRKLIADPQKMEQFLTHVVSHDWNAKFDEGHAFADGVRALAAQHPEHKDLIAAYHLRWKEMLGQSIDGTVTILRELANKKRYRLLALSNWSAETFHFARERFDFLNLFETILVSGEEKMMKPHASFYQLLENRLSADLTGCVFIDDVQKNIDAASELGIRTVLFKSPGQLRADLQNLGVEI